MGSAGGKGNSGPKGPKKGASRANPEAAPEENPEDIVSSETEAGDFPIDMECLTEVEVRELLAKARLSEDYLEKLQFNRAEFQNFKRRMERERAEWRRFGIQDLVSELLPAVDTLERAVHPETVTSEQESFLTGFRMVLDMVQEAFKKFSILPIEAEGTLFDPSRHDAQGMVDAPNAEPNSVVVELVRGYTLHDRVIRPSKVIIAKPPSAEAEDSTLEEPVDQDEGESHADL